MSSPISTPLTNSWREPAPFIQSKKRKGMSCCTFFLLFSNQHHSICNAGFRTNGILACSQATERRHRPFASKLFYTSLIRHVNFRLVQSGIYQCAFPSLQFKCATQRVAFCPATKSLPRKSTPDDICLLHSL